MKNNLFAVSAAALVAAVLFSSCQKEDIQTETPSIDGTTINVDIQASFEDYSCPDTKAYAASTVNLKWSGSETVYAYDCQSSDIVSLGTFSGSEQVKVVEGTDNRAVTLTGTITAPDAGHKVVLVVSSFAPSTSGSTITFDLSAQGTDMGAANQSDFIAYAVVDQNNFSNSKVSFTFATSVIKFSLSGLPASTAMTSASVTNVPTQCVLTLDGTAVTPSGATSGTITRTAYLLTSLSTGTASLYIAVPKLAAPGADVSRDLTVKFSSDAHADKYETYGVLGGAVEPGSYINTTRQCVKLINYPESNTYGTYVAETGCVWAPVNCGYEPATTSPASNGYQCGKLYQWGRMDGCGYTEGTVKSGSPWSVDAASGQNNEKLGKNSNYTTSSPTASLFYTEPNTTTYDWYTSDGTKQLTEWSSARPVSGIGNPCPTGWRVPTQDELGNLCYSDWNSSTHSGTAKRYGSEISTYTADGGITLLGVFLPAAGYRTRSDGSSNFRGSSACYWSSSPDPASPSYARSLGFNSGSADIGNSSRADGFSVRCVQE